MNLRVTVLGEAKCLKHGAEAKASPNRAIIVRGGGRETK